GVDAPAIEIVLAVLPVLLETAEEILEADGDRASLLVLHLNRGTVEAEQLPDLVHRQRNRAVDDLLLHRLTVRAQRTQDHRVPRRSVRESGDRREDGRAALNGDGALALGRSACGVGGLRVRLGSGLAHWRAADASTEPASTESRFWTESTEIHEGRSEP